MFLKTLLKELIGKLDLYSNDLHNAELQSAMITIRDELNGLIDKKELPTSDSDIAQWEFKEFVIDKEF